MASTSPSPSLIATAKGLAIAASFITTGSLFTASSAIIPSILHGTTDDACNAQNAAQQFALIYRAGKRTLPPAEILSVVAFSFLAYHSRQSARSPSTWKLYAGAAAAMFSVIPWTMVLMGEATQKLVQLADAPTHHPETKPTLEHKPGNGGSGLLGVPQSTEPVLTPAEEFEPFDDSPFSAEEYERTKVQKMLKQWNGRNGIRVLGPLVAGILGLCATLSE